MSCVDSGAYAAVPCMCCRYNANIIMILVCVCVCVCAICCRWHGLDGESTGEQAIERRSVRVPGAGEPAIALDWRGSNQCEGDLRCVGKLSGIFWQ